MAAELAAPGLIAVFLGMAAVAVGVGRWMGFWPTAMSSLTAWFVISILFLVVLRTLVVRWLPGDSSVQPTEEDAEAYGQIVDVVTEVNATSADGRIRFRGSSWPAISLKGALPPGSKVRLLARDNLAWVVESVDQSEADADRRLSV